MSKVFTDFINLKEEESELEILLRERLIKYLITRENVNIYWEKEGISHNPISVYNIRSTNGRVQFRYKIMPCYSEQVDDDVLTFRLCNVSFSKNKRRKGLLTGMMGIVEEFAPRFGYKAIQVECPSTPEIFSWLKKNGYADSHNKVWEKKL